MRTLEEAKEFFYTSLLADLQGLENERRKVLKKVFLAEGVIVFIVLGLIALLIKYGSSEGDAPQMVLFIGMAAISGVYFLLIKQYRSQFKDVVIAPLVKFFDENLCYVKDGYVAQNVYQEAKIFLHSVDRYHGDDHVKGMLGQTQVQFSELHTEYKTTVRTKSGTKTQWHTIFKGLFFVADFNKDFHGRTVVLADQAEKMLGGFGQFLQSKNMSRDALVKMDDPLFEKEFVVYGTDQIEARYILTSSLMKRIMDFRLKSKKPIYLSFVNSKMSVAISYNKNLFEPNVFKTLLGFAPIEEYFNDLNMAVSIVEELNLNTRIWSKE